jgi:DNA-binding PadR family transcriptional regulator
MGLRLATEKGGAAMRSPVNWSLLGLVIQRPSYGYELVQRFERTYGDSLELSSPSQIYTALDSLARRGWVEEIAAEEAGGVVRQPKPHYRATEDGRRRYQEWLIAQAHEERRRSRVFARQLAMLPAADALTVIDRYEHACLAEASNTGVHAGEEQAHDGSAGLLERLELEDERLTLEAKLAWVQYARLQFTGQSVPLPPNPR